MKQRIADAARLERTLTLTALQTRPLIVGRAHAERPPQVVPCRSAHCDQPLLSRREQVAGDKCGGRLVRRVVEVGDLHIRRLKESVARLKRCLRLSGDLEADCPGHDVPDDWTRVDVTPSYLRWSEFDPCDLNALDRWRAVDGGAQQALTDDRRGLGHSQRDATSTSCTIAPGRPSTSAPAERQGSSRLMLRQPSAPGWSRDGQLEVTTQADRQDACGLLRGARIQPTQSTAREAAGLSLRAACLQPSALEQAL